MPRATPSTMSLSTSAIHKSTMPTTSAPRPTGTLPLGLDNDVPRPPPVTEIALARATSTPAARTGGSDPATANPRVENCVRNVDEHVDQHVGAGDDQHPSLDEGIVLLPRRGDDHGPAARQAEERFDDHRAADQSPEAHSGKGD